MLDQSLALAKFKFLLFVPTSEEVLQQNITCLKLKLCCFKKIKEKLNLEIWTVNFRSPCFGIDDGYKTELYSVPFPDLWKGIFFCVCLIRPIFLKTFCQSRNWSMLLSDLMASSILELAVGWTSSVGCTQNVVNLYTSCQGPSPKSTIECSTLWRKVETPRGYTWGRSMRSTTEWGFLSANDWAITEGKRLSDPGGQCTFGVSEGVAPAPYSATRSRRAMYFWGLRGGSTGSLLCNAIRRLREGKERQRDSDLSQINVEDFRFRVVHLQSYSIEGQSVSYCRQVCLYQLNAYGLWEVKILQIKAEDLM